MFMLCNAVFEGESLLKLKFIYLLINKCFFFLVLFFVFPWEYVRRKKNNSHFSVLECFIILCCQFLFNLGINKKAANPNTT